jgi:hypothetical protein
MSGKCFLCFRTVEELWLIHLNANHPAVMEADYRGECFVCDERADLCILRDQTHGGRTNPDIDDEARERTFSLQKAIDDAIMDTEKRKETSRKMKKRKRTSTKKRTILLGDDVFIEDGDEYKADRFANDNWRPVTAEDIGITVGDSGYHSVRRPTKPMKGRKGLHQWTETARAP